MFKYKKKYKLFEFRVDGEKTGDLFQDLVYSEMIQNISIA